MKSQVATKTNKDSHGSERPPLHILYIEDDLAIGQLMKTIGELNGDIVEIAHTGEEGLNLYDTVPFDIIVIDYHLPDMTGIDIGRKILMKSPDAVLVMITGRGNERLASEALNLGFIEYLVKDDSNVFLELVPSVIEHCWRRQVEIRHLRQTRELLSEVTNRFEGLIQLSPDGLMVISGGKVVFANPAMDGVFGHKNARDLIGEDISGVVRSDAAEGIRKFVDHIIHGKLPRETFQIQNIAESGNICYLDIAAGYCEFSGAPAVQMVVHDITESKLIEEELRLAKESADQASRAKSDFLSSMSHELRTPLNAVLGFSQLLLLDTHNPISDVQRSNVQHVIRGGEHLLALIDDLLDFAKIEAGYLKVDMEACDVAPLINEAITMVSPLSQERGITIDATNTTQITGMPQAWIDPNRFRQVMVNLLSNAVKYNGNNGDVFITMEHTTPENIRISVRDTGAGIADDLEHELFEPFNRLNAEVSTIQGTGIGLPITKKLMELMGGNIDYESSVGVGSTFWVDVSVAKSQSS